VYTDPASAAQLWFLASVPYSLALPGASRVRLAGWPAAPDLVGAGGTSFDWQVQWYDDPGPRTSVVVSPGPGYFAAGAVLPLLPLVSIVSVAAVDGGTLSVTLTLDTDLPPACLSLGAFLFGDDGTLISTAAVRLSPRVYRLAVPRAVFAGDAWVTNVLPGCFAGDGDGVVL
jgi:hypothetical protein